MFPEQSEFENWLIVYREPNDTISAQWSMLTCPLCMFLEDTGLASSATVYPEAFSLSEAGVIWPLPNWAKEFSYWADLVFPRTLSASDCLFLLRDFPGYKPDIWDNGGRRRMWRPSWVKSET